MAFGFCIGRKGYRVELYIWADEEKRLIDAMSQYKNEINQKFKLGEIQWERLEGKKASRIKFEKTSLEITGDADGWRNNKDEAYINWYCDVMKAFYNTLLPYWTKVNRNVE